MFKRITNHPRIYFAIITFVAVFGIIVVGNIAYRGERATEERDLIARAQTIAYLLEPREITFLVGDESDRGNPFYISLKQRFEKLKESNSDVRFIYLTGVRDIRASSTLASANTDGQARQNFAERNLVGQAGIFFYLDSEPESSPDYSPPGQNYTEASATFQEVFGSGRSRFEGPLADRWGEWISAFVPIRHPGTEKVIAVLGMDISAVEYHKRILFAVATPAIFILLLLAVLFIVFREYRKREEVLSLKAEFISIASHELRSPLTGLSWAVQTLLRNEEVTKLPALKDTLVLMERTFKSMLETVAGILDFSRLEHMGAGGLKISLFNLRELVGEGVDALTLFANEKKVSIVLADDFPARMQSSGDREKIKRAINNIISNAVKYSSSPDTVRIAYHRDGKNHVISVANSGQVIPQEDHKKIFSKFFRAGNATTATVSGIPGGRTGTGLGLYFAKQIIEAHSGKIWFESSEEKGTTFYIALPAFDETPK